MSISAVSSSASTVQTQSWIPDCQWIDSLSEKYSLNWQSNLMIAGVVAAVGCAVGAFFLNMAAFGVAFIALATLLAYGAYCAHNSINGAALEQTITELKEQKLKLETDKNNIAANAAQVQRQFDAVQATNRQLNQTVNAHQTSISALQSTNRELTRTNTEMRADLENLRGNNVALQQRVTQLQSTIPLLKEQITGFTNQNVLLGKNLNIVGVEAVEVNHLAKELGKKIGKQDMTFDKDVLELSEQIQRANIVSEKLFSALNDQRKEQAKQIQALNSSGDHLQTFEKKLQAQTQHLTTIEQQVIRKTEDLTNLNQKWTEAQISFEDTKNALSAETIKLDQLKLNFSIAQAELEATKNEMLAYPQKLEDLKNLNEKLCKAQASFEETKNALSSETIKLEQLKLNLSTTQSELEAAKTELLSYPQKLEELQKLNDELSRAQVSLEDTKKALEAETIKLEQLQLNLSDAESKLEAARSELSTYPQKFKDAEDLLNRKINNVEIRQAKAIEAAQLNLSKKTAQVGEKKGEIATLKKDIEGKKLEFETLISNIDTKNKELAQKIAQIDEKKLEFEALMSAIDAKKQEPTEIA